MLASKCGLPSIKPHAHQTKHPRICSAPAAAAAAGSSSSRQHKILLRAASEGSPSSSSGTETQYDLPIPLSSAQGSQLAYILSSGEGNERVLFDPAVKTYLTELQQERDMEAAMEAEAAADAAAEAAAAAAAAAAGDSSNGAGAADAPCASSSSEGACDVEDTWDDSALMKRIKALREAERGQIVADIVYLEVAKALLQGGLQLLGNVALLSPQISQPPGSFVSKQKLSRSSMLSPAVVDAVLSYMVSTFEGGDGELMRVASPAATPLSVDRIQAARLYAGLLEFGYFAAALEAACREAGVEVGADSGPMIGYADSLPEVQLRKLCAVQSADGWWSAVRHIGYVFGLTPNEDAFDSFGLPYPDLSVTISQIQMEPAANMWEHFNTPGSAARLAAKSADKTARGWSGADAEGALPDADLLTFEFGLFQRMLLEAAVYGAVLFGVEQRLESEYGYKLSSREDREDQAGQLPL